MTRSTMTSAGALHDFFIIGSAITTFVGMRLLRSIACSVCNISAVVHRRSVAISNCCLATFCTSFGGNCTALTSCTCRIYACVFNVLCVTCVPRVVASCLGLHTLLLYSKSNRREHKDNYKRKDLRNQFFNYFHFILRFHNYR